MVDRQACHSTASLAASFFSSEVLSSARIRPMVGYGLTTVAMSYILLRDFLRPWALKLGAGTDWQLDVFNDLVGPAHDQLHYIPITEDDEPAIKLIGRRFRCKAVLDIRRDDTLFVYEILGAFGERPTRKVNSRWELARGDRWLTRSPPVRIPELPPGVPAPYTAPAPPAPEKLRHILAGMTPKEFFGFLAPLKPQEPATLLKRMRELFKLGGPFASIPVNEREHLILRDKLSPGDPQLAVAELHSRFSLGLLAQAKNTGEQKLVLEAILTLPPVPSSVQTIIQQWLLAASRPEFEDRLRHVVSWLDQCDEASISRPAWVKQLKEAFTTRLKSSGPVSDKTLGKAFSNWASLQQWAHPASEPPATAEAGMAAAVVLEPIPPPMVELTETPVAAADASEPASQALAAGEDPKGVLRSVLLRIRTNTLLDSRPKLFATLGLMEQRSREAQSMLQPLPELDAFQKTRERMEELASMASQARSLLPDRQQIEQIDGEITEALSQIPSRFAPGAVASWLAQLKTWDDVKQVLALLNSPVMQSLPEWFFRDLAPGERPVDECILDATVEPQKRQALLETVVYLSGYIQAHPELTPQLVQLERAEGETAFLRLRRAIEASDAERRVAERLEHLTTQTGPWVRDLFDTADLSPKDALQSIEALVEQLDRLSKVAPRVREEIVTSIASVGDLRKAHAQLDEIEATFKPLGPLAGDLDRLDLIRKFSALAQAGSRRPEPSETTFEMAHCISENGVVTAARLVARKATEEEGLFLTNIPLNVKTPQPGTFTFQFEVSAPHLENRPAEWRQRVENITVRVDQQDWFRQGDRFAASITFKDIPVPASWASQPPQVLSLKVKGREVETQRAMEEKEFTFKPPSFTEPQIELPFSDTTSLKDMRRHPLGIQVHFDELSQFIQSGRSSFLIAAPRRFGKTTLLKALVEALSSSDVVVLAPTPADPQTSITKKFQEICEQLGNRVGAHVGTGWSEEGLLPDENTFDQARERAAQEGKKAIYVLLDEAQALFARRHGKKAAEQLKSRIERAWGSEKKGLVPIRFGLVGQLHLQRLIAGQLDGVFPKSYKEVEIQPERIERLLREFTRDQMQSTQDARRLLADVSRNFFILQVLLDEIRSILSEEKRTWFLRGDVIRAMETAMEQALRLPGQPLVSYLRDPLNASDDLTVWHPIPAYPVAVAWAVVLADGKQGAARLHHARELLDKWAQEFNKKFIVPVSRIEECLQALKDRLILGDDLSFCSPLLQRYFERVGKSSSPLREASEKAALHTLVVDEVPLPDERREENSGGQATVYSAHVEGRECAVRLMNLSGEQERLAFIETCYALKAIEGTRKRALGYMSLPTLRAAGLTHEPEPQGIVIYDWIPGKDLAHFRGKMEDPLVVSIGKSLAEALSVLEQREVLHRDIRLENIILQPSGVPVLVDFGLARQMGYSPATPRQSPSMAPEVALGKWSAKADVYALAWVLKELRGMVDPKSPVTMLLDAAMNPDVEKRLDARQFVEQFGGLADQMNIDRQRLKHELRFQTEVNAVTTELARSVATNHLPSMVATAAGFFRAVDALQLVAQFVDDVFNEWHLQKFHSPRHLTFVMNTPNSAQVPPELRPLQHKESAATGFLRHGHAHRNSHAENLKKAQLALNTSGTASYEILRDAVVATADRVERALQQRGVGRIVRAWLGVS